MVQHRGRVRHTGRPGDLRAEPDRAAERQGALAGCVPRPGQGRGARGRRRGGEHHRRSDAAHPAAPVGEGDAMSTAAPSLSELKDQVDLFLTHEADLVDRHKYDDWLALWSPDGVYWVPCNEDDYDPARHVSIIYDDYNRLQERCFRLNQEGAHSQDPPSRLCRVVGNLAVSLSGEGHVLVRANMILVDVRSGEKN